MCIVRRNFCANSSSCLALGTYAWMIARKSSWGVAPDITATTQPQVAGQLPNRPLSTFVPMRPRARVIVHLRHPRGITQSCLRGEAFCPTTRRQHGNLGPVILQDYCAWMLHGDSGNCRAFFFVSVQLIRLMGLFPVHRKAACPSARARIV